MQRKLKSVFHKSSRSRDSPVQQSENDTHYAEASSPRSDRHRVSSDRHGRTSVDSSVNGSVHTGRSRPVSAVYDDRRQSQASARPTSASGLASHQSSDPNGGAIANDYRAYLPALSPVNDDHGDEYMTLGGEERYITGDRGGRHKGVATERNVRKSIDGRNQDPAGVTHNRSAGIASNASALNQTKQQPLRKELESTVNSAGTGGSVGKHTASRDSTRPYTETSPQEKGAWKGTGPPSKAARVEIEPEKRKPRISDSANDASRLPRETHKVKGAQSGMRHATMDGTAHGEETELARQLREDNVVDLRNTVDTDGDVRWAPAVTRETIKPHQHEIVQQKIYREIHNYEYFPRIQPVTMTEVLPPRHWIPNPDGEGLIEISAKELPARTGENRWWSICEHSSPYALQRNPRKYRTEPEVIEAGTFITEEGFERKETIIVYPPTLADLTGYAGPVQTVHFDHKTGERWMGELTTMDKLHELQQTLDRAPDAQAFQMDGLAESLPKAPSSSMPLRKPVSGQSSRVHGSNAGRNMK